MDLNKGITQLIISEGKKKGILRNQLAYVLATAYHETAFTMLPVRETLAKTDDSAVNILERSWKAGKLKWVKNPYWRKDSEGKSWIGRGLVQLTHKVNYEKAGEKLGVDLVKDPTLAMNPEVATKIAIYGMIEGWFTGKKLSDYITLKKSDFIGARYIINGTDKRDTIALYAKQYDADLLKIGYGVEKVKK